MFAGDTELFQAAVSTSGSFGSPKLLFSNVVQSPLSQTMTDMALSLSMSFAASFPAAIFVFADRIVPASHLRPMKQRVLHQVVHRSALANDRLFARTLGCRGIPAKRSQRSMISLFKGCCSFGPKHCRDGSADAGDRT